MQKLSSEVSAGWYENVEGDKHARLTMRDNGVFYLRIYLLGERKYKHVSLGTAVLKEARKKALSKYLLLQVRREEGLPIFKKKFADVVEEYVRVRTNEQRFDKKRAATGNKKRPISDGMVRQMNRVSKFLIEFAGPKAVDAIDNNSLKAYVIWRNEYYSNIPVEERPRNHKLNPKDKTLLWEITFFKTILRYACEKGYRGNKVVPDYKLQSVNAIVRPPFEVDDYKKVYRAFPKWIAERDKGTAWRATRELVRDYVLILANSGLRTGEANDLRWCDVSEFSDVVNGVQRKNCRLILARGKTGARTVIPRSSVHKYLARVRKTNPPKEETDFVFRMPDGEKVKTLSDQFKKLLKFAGATKNSKGEEYVLYSLRHFYAVRALAKQIPVWDVAANMGTSVEVIQSYYGKQAGPEVMRVRLGH